MKLVLKYNEDEEDLETAEDWDRVTIGACLRDGGGVYIVEEIEENEHVGRIWRYRKVAA